MSHEIRRREFLQQVGASVAGGAIAPALLSAREQAPASQPVGSIRHLPLRTLGRTGVQVPVLSFGTAPMGHALYEQEPFEQVIEAALSAGIRYFDTAPIYDVAEQRLGAMMGRIRRNIFLVSKTHVNSREEAMRDVEASLKRLHTDHLDLLHLHNVGRLEQEQAIGKGGVLEALLELKRQGVVRHIGCTGHLRPARFIPVLETGAIDVLMVAMNFVDHHTYNFEEKVLPVARKQNCGIVCMKVYGGVTGSWDGYLKKQPGRLAGDRDRQDAVDYALSLPGVATAVVGIKSIEELRLTVQAVLHHKPLDETRRATLLARGREMSRQWGDHFGPVA